MIEVLIMWALCLLKSWQWNEKYTAQLLYRCEYMCATGLSV